MKGKLSVLMNSSRLFIVFLFVSFHSFAPPICINICTGTHSLMEFQPKRLLLDTMAYRFIRTDRAQLANNFVRIGAAVIAAVFHIGNIQGKIFRRFCRIVFFFVLSIYLSIYSKLQLCWNQQIRITFSRLNVLSHWIFENFNILPFVNELIYFCVLSTSFQTFSRSSTLFILCSVFCLSWK